MSRYNMFLTNEEKEILMGGKGETLRKAMESVVKYGEIFGAKRLVPINGPVHLVTSFGVTILKPVFNIMDELIENGYKTAKPFTVNPRPLDYKNIKCSILEKIVFKIMYGKQKQYEKQLEKVGLKDKNAYTCAAYFKEVGNIPKQGDILSWAESSAVVYANSVLGARTNRNSGVIELLSGIIGKTPEFGFITDEGRKASFVIELKTTKLPSPQVLGSAIGLKVIEDVPYILNLDKFLGEGLTSKTKDYLKDMGAASASNGAVGLYHVSNITPEAVQMGKSLLKENYETYIIDDVEIKRVLDSYPVLWKDLNGKPDFCFVGCPHLSIDQLKLWIDNISMKLKLHKKSKVGVYTILCTPPDVFVEFEKDEAYVLKLKEIGAHVTSICPLMYMNNPICAKHNVITNSNKLRTYTTARYFEDEKMLKLIAGESMKEVISYEEGV